MRILTLATLSFLFIQTNKAFSQACATCSIDYTYTSPGVYPDTLPPATAGEFYEADITFVMQDDTTVDVVGTLDFLNYYIMEPVGMPYGMHVSTDLGDLPVNYDPTVSLYGCARVCGTPLVAGWYEVTVPLVATLEFPGGDQAASYSIYLEVLPAAPTGGGIIPTASFGCEPLNVDFETGVHSMGADGFSYTWDFGNGATSTSEFPPSQSYVAVGGVPTDYVIMHTVSIDTIGYTLDYVTALSSGCDDCTIFGCTGLIESEKPDLYIIIADLGVNTEPGFANTSPPVTFSLGNTLDPLHTYTMQMKDDDGGLAGSDDNCGSFTFDGNDVGISTLSAGSHQVEVSISHPVITYTFYDTITVYPEVTVPVLDILGETTFCSTDSAVLSTTEVAGLTYQWYKDGDPIPGGDATSLVVYTSGSYFLSATGTGGCYANSDSVVITVFEQPTAPNIIVIGNTLTTSSTWDVQWYYNGDPIPGATSTSYTPAIEGLYQVAAVNGPCMAYSVEVDFVFQSVNEVFMPSLQITPNPNEGQFICDFSVTELQDIQIRVTNMLGEVVYSNELHNIIGNNQFAIDLTPADTGIYLLDIQSSKGHIIRKIVVQ